jgi:hypothetical protein
VVPVVSAYTAVLLIDDTLDVALGRTACDLNDNAVIYLRGGMARGQLESVLLHERIHVAQTRAFAAGCSAYVARYNSDDAFRLRVEAEAFCGVYEVQMRVSGAANPNLLAIVQTLMQQRSYKATWTPADVRRAMRCWAAAPDTAAKRLAKLN